MPPSGKFVALSAGNRTGTYSTDLSYFCGVRTDATIACWSDDIAPLPSGVMWATERYG